MGLNDFTWMVFIIVLTERLNMAAEVQEKRQTLLALQQTIWGRLELLLVCSRKPRACCCASGVSLSLYMSHVTKAFVPRYHFFLICWFHRWLFLLFKKKKKNIFLKWIFKTECILSSSVTRDCCHVCNTSDIQRHQTLAKEPRFSRSQLSNMLLLCIKTGCGDVAVAQ